MSGEGSLAGLTVAVTRPPTKGDRLSEELRARGASVVEAPAIRVVPAADPEPLRRAAARLQAYDWVVVTSAAGIEALAGALAPGEHPRRLAVVGTQTAAAAEAIGWRADLVPARFDAEGVLEAFDAEGRSVGAARVLLPLARAARDVLAEGLARRGARVESVVAYETVAGDASDLAPLAEAIREGRVDLLTFTSSSAARNVAAGVGPAALAIPAAAIGPVTAATAREVGYPVVAIAREHTIEGLVHAVDAWWGGR